MEVSTQRVDLQGNLRRNTIKQLPHIQTTQYSQYQIFRKKKQLHCLRD